MSDDATRPRIVMPPPPMVVDALAAEVHRLYMEPLLADLQRMTSIGVKVKDAPPAGWRREFRDGRRVLVREPK
jgi:hypothetical protein